MNKAEAKEILAQELIHLQAKSFEDLQMYINSPEVTELIGASGVTYQIELEAFWDNPRESNGALRIIASIDDGKFLSTLLPLSADFIMDPDGTVK
jgi:hypothetical protein